MKKFRALSCFVFALCLVFYAVPRLPFQGISQLATGFSFIWLAFAILVIGSNLFYVIGEDQSGSGKRKRNDFTVVRDRGIIPEGNKQGTRSFFK
ncbi:MAG TPA: hypothetical protein VJ824_04410 [Bacillota bacterium]|nr:hypothetical protein [Bacillota bacterium]